MNTFVIPSQERPPTAIVFRTSEPPSTSKSSSTGLSTTCISLMATESQSDSSDKYELEKSGYFHLGSPMNWLASTEPREPRHSRHSGLMERLKVCCNLLFDRRNIVKLPVITVKLFCIVLQCTAVLLLCIISFGVTAGYRRTTKLLQRHVKETLPVLKETVLTLARSQRFSKEFTRSQLFPLGGLQSFDGKYDYDEQDFDPPSLDKRWRRFHSGKLICWLFGEFRTMHLQWAVTFCLCVACFPPVTENI